MCVHLYVRCICVCVCVYVYIHVYIPMCASPTGCVKVATHQVFQTAQLQVFTCTCSSCHSLGTLSHIPLVYMRDVVSLMQWGYLSI